MKKLRDCNECGRWCYGLICWRCKEGKAAGEMAAQTARIAARSAPESRAESVRLTRELYAELDK